VEGIVSNAESVADHSYPIIRNLAAIVSKQPPPEVALFLELALNPALANVGEPCAEID